MQEQLLQPPVISAETKSVAKIERDLRQNGYLDPITRQEIIDEEKTHAVEILALITRHGCVPREYIFIDNDLRDEYGYSIDEVIVAGVVDAQEKIVANIPGAAKELRRRQIELEVLRGHVLTLPVGGSCIEWSTTDDSWTDEEKLAHGYTGKTHARVTSRSSENEFVQLNIILPHNDLKIINRCRRLIDPDSVELGSAEEILASPQRTTLDISKPVDIVKFIETEFSRALLSTHTSLAVTNMLKSLFRKRRDAKEYVFAQDDIFEAMVDSFIDIAGNDVLVWRSMVDVTRGGAWHLLIERYKRNDKYVEDSASQTTIKDAAIRAASVGAVFTACGGSVDMKTVISSSTPPLLERIVVVRTLLVQETGRGKCSSCGASGGLFGCGVFCKSCNDIWCDEYLKTGEQLEPRQIVMKRYFGYSRGR